MRIAIVGGGIAGSCAAAELSRHLGRVPGGGEVVVFDQGRRGPGGRASHRSVDASTGDVLPDDEEFLPSAWGGAPAANGGGGNGNGHPSHPTLQFDHGCQFFRADTPAMQGLVRDWLLRGWVAPWKARLGCLAADGSGSAALGGPTDFFGVPSRPEDVYVGVGGMHLLPRNLLNDSGAVVHRGTRVRGVQRNHASGKWELDTVVGDAAYHDSREDASASSTSFPPLPPSSSAGAQMDDDARSPPEGFDAVVFTDISSSSDSWHRAGAGIPDSLRRRLPKDRVRVPLFSCMVALSRGIAHQLPFDAFTVSSAAGGPSGRANGLWFAAVSHSKPGFPQRGDVASPDECWTLISTPSFAVDQIRETTMRDPATGQFRPQEDAYLNSVPGPALARSFLDVIGPHLLRMERGSDDGFPALPEVTYLQAQRWGSGLPLPEKMAGDVEEICGTRYAACLAGGDESRTLVFPRPVEIEQPDYVFDDELGLYYAGDFVSHRNPGFEAAALSGVDVARHIIAANEWER